MLNKAATMSSRGIASRVRDNYGEDGDGDVFFPLMDTQFVASDLPTLLETWTH